MIPIITPCSLCSLVLLSCSPAPSLLPPTQHLQSSPQTHWDKGGIPGSCNDRICHQKNSIAPLLDLLESEESVLPTPLTPKQDTKLFGYTDIPAGRKRQMYSPANCMFLPGHRASEHLMRVSPQVVVQLRSSLYHGMGYFRCQRTVGSVLGRH